MDEINSINKKPIQETIIKAKQDKITTEIDDILNEIPIENKKPEKKQKSKKELIKKKPISSNKKKYSLIAFLMGLFIIGIILFLLFSFFLNDCTCENIVNNIITPVDGYISFDLIKEQITKQGYIEITKDEVTLKLAPYIK